MPGNTISVPKYTSDLALATTPLSETTDADSIALPNPALVNVSIAEYGSAIFKTRKLGLTAFSDVDVYAAQEVAWHMRDTVDELVQTTLRGGTQFLRNAGGVLSTSTAITNVVATDFITSAAVRRTVAKLRSAKVPPKAGPLYAGYLHPEVSHDLRAETASGGYREAHIYAAPAVFWPGVIGEYEGIAVTESPRCYNAVDGGAGGNTVRVFRSYVLGRYGLLESVWEEFHTVAGPITDSLNRFRPLGWYGAAGWARFREEAMWRIETTSSIHTGA